MVQVTQYHQKQQHMQRIVHVHIYEELLKKPSLDLTEQLEMLAL